MTASEILEKWAESVRLDLIPVADGRYELWLSCNPPETINIKMAGGTADEVVGVMYGFTSALATAFYKGIERVKP